MSNYARTTLMMTSLSLVVEASAPAALVPAFHGLGDLPGGPDYSMATAVSRDGSMVVGVSGSAPPGYSTGYEPFRWTGTGGLVGLGSIAPAGNIHGCANGVSADGSVVVGWSGWGGGQAFRWTSSTGMTSLGTLPGGGPVSNALATSADGSVIIGSGQATDGAHEPMRWTAGQGMVSLGRLYPAAGGMAAAASPDASVIVGWSGYLAFRWTEADGMASLGDLPGGSTESAALATSADGSVIVGYATNQFGKQAARWSQETGWIVLAGPGSLRSSRANAITADGTVIVGDSSPGSPGDYYGAATIWTQAGPRAIHEMLENDFGLDLAGWRLDGATGISDDGRVIVGTGVNPAGISEGWVAIIPEPSMFSMVLLATMGIIKTAKGSADFAVER